MKFQLEPNEVEAIALIIFTLSAVTALILFITYMVGRHG